MASFFYGILHAAGPGHGKAVISSYLLASGDTLRRGLWLTWASSLLQGVMAFVFVFIAVKLFNLSQSALRTSMNTIDMLLASFLVFIGIRLLYSFVKNPLSKDSCTHIPPAEQLRQRRNWRDDASLIATIAIRPCSGAVLILIYCLSKGLLLNGILAVMLISIGTAMTVSLLAIIAVSFKKIAVRLAATGSNTGFYFYKSLEILAALFLIGLGLAMLTGYFALEKFLPIGLGR
jgi:ABC-type nickel/cobalt efflux system permease component RcnA